MDDENPMGSWERLSNVVEALAVSDMGTAAGDLYDIVAKGLAKSADDRYGSIKELVEDLGRVGPASAPPGGTTMPIIWRSLVAGHLKVVCKNDE